MQPKYGKAALSLKRMVQNGIMSEREKADFPSKGDVLVAKQKKDRRNAMKASYYYMKERIKQIDNPYVIKQ